MWNYKGEMAERFNVPPWKGGVPERVPGVRIPLSPPVYSREGELVIGALTREREIEINDVLPRVFEIHGQSFFCHP